MKGQKRLQTIERALVDRDLAALKATIKRAGPDWELDFDQILPRLEFFRAQEVPLEDPLAKGLPPQFAEQVRS